MAAPLAGFRLIEFASLMSGPYAGLLLAQLGMEVIKVESPSGDMTRQLPPFQEGMSASFFALNQGKQSVVLDLKRSEATGIALDLIATADVVIQNWRPGVARELGLESRMLREKYPELITVSVSGFGNSGPYARERVYDSIIQAVSGMAATQGKQVPSFVQTYLPDKLAALAAVQGVLSALLGRTRSGRGTHIDVNMLDAAIAFQWPDVLRGLVFPGTSSESEAAPRIGLLIKAKDNRWLSVSPVTNREWEALCARVGRTDLIEEFPDVSSRKIGGKRIASALQDHLSKWTRDEILAMLRDSDVPCAPVNSSSELVLDPQVKFNETILEQNYPGIGDVRTATPMVQAEDWVSEMLAAPQFGEHTDGILSELGYSDENKKQLKARGVVRTISDAPRLR